MIVRVNTKDNTVNVYVAGRIDSLCYVQFEKALEGKINENSNVIFNFSDVEYICALGIKSLLGFKKKASKGSLKIINASDEVYDTFKVSGFDTLIEVNKITDYELMTYIGWSFKKLLKLKAQAYPDFVYLKDALRSYTYEEIEKISQIIAYDLSKKGVKKGTHVGIYGNNSVNWVLTFFAIQKIGGIACLLNNAYNVADLKKVSAIGDIEFLCYGDSELEKNNEHFLDEIIEDENLCLKDFYCFKSSINFKDRIHEYDAISGLFENYVEHDDICAMIFTSGSTGAPKGVMLSAFNIINASYSMAYRMHVKENDKLCLILPLFHIFGLTAGLICNCIYNASVYFPENIRTSTVLSAIYTEKCTIFHSVPTMILALINNPEFSSEKVKTIKNTVLAGAATTKAQLETMVKYFPNNHFQIAYGLSEMAPISMTDFDEDISKIATTVGKPVSYINVRIEDLSTRKECAVGEQGEVVASGYNTFSGYYKLELEKQAIDDNGLIRTGDIGYIDEEGYLHLTGRAKELIIRGGENIVPNEVASEISTHPDIADVKVVGIPDDFYGEVVCACLLMNTDKEFNKEEMIKYLSTRLTKQKMPAYYIVYNKFPLLGSGKVDMVNLKKDAIMKCKGE